LTAKQADDLLKGIRKAAVKAIHETCKSSRHDDDDEDEDENDDDDEDEDRDDEDDAPTSGLLFTGTPAEIAQQATTAMDLVMDAVRAASQPTSTAKPGGEKDRDVRKDKGKSKKGGRD